jgi:lysophospholipase L1-like esterase
MKTQTIGQRLVLWATLCTSLAVGLAACGGGGNEGGNEGGSGSEQAKATWTSPLGNAFLELPAFNIAPPVTEFKDTTMRASATVSVGADRHRVKFSNAYGTSDLKIEKIVLARGSDATTADPTTNVQVTFSGSASVTIPKGGEALSDPVAITAAAGDRIMVSWFFDQAIVASTGNGFGATQVATGDQTAAATLSGATSARFGYLLAEIAADDTRIDKVVVAIGDSITAGTGGNGTSYPGKLQEAISANPTLAGTMSVVNQGIPGNRILHSGFGQSMLERFDRDALGVSGVTHIILFLGINDIQLDYDIPSEKVTAGQMITALDGLVKKAKAEGHKIFLGTILPWKGTVRYTEEREAVRKAVNAWIRANADVNAVFDFDAAMRSQEDASALNSALHSGDFVHPNAAGYAVMASLVNLALL